MADTTPSCFVKVMTAGRDGLLTVTCLRAEQKLPRCTAADELMRLPHAIARVQGHCLQGTEPRVSTAVQSE